MTGLNYKLSISKLSHHPGFLIENDIINESNFTLGGDFFQYIK